jgi:RNA polymerase sigma-70 factor (ECF subfamily)
MVGCCSVSGTPRDADPQRIEGAVAADAAAGRMREAAETAIRAYGPAIFRYLLALMRDRATAEDVFGVFCEDLWRGLPGFRWESSLKTWAYKLAWHAAQRHRRSDRKRTRRLATSEISAIAAEVRSSTAPHARTSAKDRLAAVRRRLSLEEQTLLTLRIDRRLSWDEVAEVLSTADLAVDAAVLRKRFERLKDRLKVLMDRAGPGS